MDIDDTSDKLRRNTLLLSFFIVAGEFLNLSLSTKGQLWSLVSYEVLSVARVWWLITFVLIYLFLRYWFDNSRKKDYVEYKNTFEAERVIHVRKLLEKLVKNALLQNRASSVIVNFSNQLDELSESYNQYNLPKEVNVWDCSLEFDTINKWRGVFSVSYAVYWLSGYSFTTLGRNLSFNVPKIAIYRIYLKIYIKLLTISKPSVDLFIPIIMSFMAFIICANHLFGLCKIL